MKTITKVAGVATSALLLTGAVAPLAHATSTPSNPLPPGMTTHCEGNLVHQEGDEISLRVRRLSNTKFCAYVTKGYSKTPYQTKGKLAGIDITTGAYTTEAKSSWGKYVYIPFGECVQTSLGIQEAAGEAGGLGTFCNVI